MIKSNKTAGRKLAIRGANWGIYEVLFDFPCLPWTVYDFWWMKRKNMTLTNYILIIN